MGLFDFGKKKTAQETLDSRDAQTQQVLKSKTFKKEWN